MNVTVAICTWNRAQLLDQTLEQMHHLRIPDGVEWELIVVNNNSSDNTDEVIDRHAMVLPIRRVFEPTPGLSNARNAAIEAAHGELLIWTDDDVLVSADWVEAYVNAYREFPDTSFFGGPVEPWFEVTPPPWLQSHLSRLQGPYAVRDFGTDVRPFEPNEFPFGANMAFRLKVLREHHFNPQLGRIGSSMLSGDETAVLSAMREGGHTGICVGTAIVRHFIPRERITTKWLWSYFHGTGQTKARMTPQYEGRQLFGAPRHLWRTYVENLAILAYTSASKGSKWLRAFRTAATAKGQIVEHRRTRAV